MQTIVILVFVTGWLLFVAGQAQNSLKSKTNALQGWAGFKVWLQAQAVNLSTRAFFSAIGYNFIVHTVSTKAAALGFPVTSYMIAGVGGWAANGMLYQFFGLFPFLRVEVADLAPPSTTNTGGTQ